MQMLTAVNNSAYGPTGLPVITSAITITGQGSTIARDSGALDFRILAVGNTGELTLQKTTVSRGISPFGGGGGVLNYGILTVFNSIITGNFSSYGGGVANSGTGTVTNSTITGNSAHYGGGVYNGGILTITNSTIAGNAIPSYFPYGSGGGVSNSGIAAITNSTIADNIAGDYGGGMRNIGTLTLVRTLVAGNTAPTGPEISNDISYGGTVLADNHNLFGVNGTAGVVGFSLGATDIVPPTGVLLPGILDPTLAFHGGFTQTHALVPGSPAIDAGGTDCTDATGAPLPTDQRGKPRVVDGNGDGTAACDIGAFEFFPVVNDFVTLDAALNTAFNPTPGPEAPAGTFTITALFINTSDTALRFPFFTVTQL
jgi:hypothetical protein